MSPSENHKEAKRNALQRSNTSENAHARTMCLCSKECNTSPVNASHNFLHV